MKKFKKLLAVVLSAVLMLSVMPFAMAKDVSYEQTCPYIYIHGFVGNVIYDDPSSPDAKALFPPEADAIIDMVKNCAPALSVYLLNKDADTLSKTLVPELTKLLGGVFLDEEGNVPNKSGIKFTWPSKSSINKYSRLAFEYDWRLDPMEIADQLDAYINYVCEASGCDKVSIMAHSCGGIITLAYAAKYGTDKLSGVVMNSTAVYGETCTGELMTGDLKLDMNAVKAFLQYIMSETEYDTLIDGVMDIFGKAGILSSFEAMGNDFIADEYDEIMGNILLPMFTRWPTIWAMTPDEYLEAAEEYIYNGKYSGDSAASAVFRAKLESYNSLVRGNRDNLIKELEANGHFGVYARYGFSSVPVTSSWQNLSDGVVDTKFASYGATTASYGEKLSESYLAGVDAKYVSPDKTVDASTCMFPEKTWFVKNYGHTHSQLLPELTNAILFADEEVTVDTYEAYPQFIIYADNEFVPQEKDDTLNPIQRYIRMLKQLIELIKGFFSKLFNK